MADEIKIELVVDSDGIIKSIEKKAPEAEKAGKKVGDNLSKGILAAGIGATVAGALATAAVLKAASAIGEKIVEGVEAAIVQAESVNKLNNALATTGQFSRQASADLQRFASDLQSMTRFGDEAIIGQLAFAQSMGASAEQSKQIVSAATDMATALDIDLNSAVRNITKTLGGYAGELGEVIPALKELTKEQLQAGQGIDLLEKQFESFAKLSAESFQGRLEQLQNSYGDLTEKIGESVVQSGFIRLAMQKARIVLDNFIKGADFSFIVEGLKRAALASLGLFESISKVALAYATLTNNQKIISFFSDTHAAALNLKQGIEGLTESEIKRAESERESALVKKSSLVEEMKLMELRNARSKHEAQLAEEQAKRNSELLKKQKQELASFSSSIKTQFVGGMVTAFSSFGRAMATGGNAFKDFGKNVLNTIGSLAIQMGQFFILVGSAMSATKVFMGLGGAAAIAAGVGLTVLGGVLQGMSGGGGGGSVSTASVGGGGMIESDATLVNTTGDVAGFNDSSAIEKQQQVQLVVQGDVLDSEETGTRLLQILNEEFDNKGGRIAYA